MYFLLNYSTLQQHGQDLLMVRRERTKIIPYPFHRGLDTHHSRSLLPLPRSKGEERHIQHLTHSRDLSRVTIDRCLWVRILLILIQNLPRAVWDPGQVRFPCVQNLFLSTIKNGLLRESYILCNLLMPPRFSLTPQYILIRNFGVQVCVSSSILLTHTHPSARPISKFLAPLKFILKIWSKSRS